MVWSVWSISSVWSVMRVPLSSGSPRVGLLHQLEVDERLAAPHRRDRPDAVVEQLQQAVVVRADELDDDVERPGGDHHVVDLVEGRELGGDGLDVALDVDADHGLAL